MHLKVIIPKISFGVLWATRNQTSFCYSCDGTQFLIMLACCLAHKIIPGYKLWENIFGDKVISIEWENGKKLIAEMDIWATKGLTDFLLTMLKDMQWSGELPKDEDSIFQSSIVLTNCKYV